MHSPIVYFSELYSGELPIFKKQDAFEVLVPLTFPKTAIKTRFKVLELMDQIPVINKQEIAKKLKLSSEGIRYHISILKAKQMIKYEGPAKGGRWIIRTKNELN